MNKTINRQLIVLQVNYRETVGGAARIAWMLHNELRERSQNTWMAVAQKDSESPFVKTVPVNPSRFFLKKLLFHLTKEMERAEWKIGKWQLSGLFRRLAEPRRYWQRYQGKEDFNFPGSHRILDLPPLIPDLVHLHNLHRNYFDLGFLPELSHQVPTLLTLHDKWLLTGHCAHSLDCERWKSGCGECPYLDIYPPIQRDATAYNWSRKKDIFKRSKVYITAPSKWLLDEVEKSMLRPAVMRKKVIHNSVDLSVFYPGDKNKARHNLSLPVDSYILLFVASDMDANAYKDYKTIQAAIELVTRKIGDRKILFLALGSEKDKQQIGNATILPVPFQRDLEVVASYFRAADIYLHAAEAETFGNVIVESLACGTPVIATEIGGIPEIIREGKTGFLTPLEDEFTMAERIIYLLENRNLISKLGEAATKDVRTRFSLDRMTATFLDYYWEIVHDWRA